MYASSIPNAPANGEVSEQDDLGSEGENDDIQSFARKNARIQVRPSLRVGRKYQCDLNSCYAQAGVRIDREKLAVLHERAKYNENKVS